MIPRSARGPRAHRAIKDAIPIAKARGLIQLATGGPERIYDISIVSKIPIVFVSVMFAPQILAPVPELVDYYKNDLARLRVNSPRCRERCRALDPVPPRHLAVLSRDPGHDRGDRPRREVDRDGRDDRVPRRGCSTGAGGGSNPLVVRPLFLP